MEDGSQSSVQLPKTVHDLLDDLLELVFLRLPACLHLVRAACTCKRWRRVIADGGFLRRFHTRRPAVAGLYRVDERTHGSRPPGCDPIFVPSPSADSVDLRHWHFSLDFLPACGGGFWDLADSRGGILLLNECTPDDEEDAPFNDLVVCEPITRRHRVIPPPAWLHGCPCLGSFLLDADAADEASGGCISLSNFRIITVLVHRGSARACVFSSGSGSWTVVRSMANVRPVSRLYFAGHVQESVYWKNVHSEIIVLNKATGELSCSSFPEESWQFKPEVVGCDGGMVRIARLDNSRLKVFILAEGSHEWVLEKSVQLAQSLRSVRGLGWLDVYTKLKIVLVAKGSVVLGTKKGVGLVRVDLSTMKFKRLHDENKYNGPSYTHQFPLPTIRACLPL